MNTIINMLPYGLLLLAAVIAFFLKGNNVNKFLNLVFFAAGMFCICAESGWWRFGFIVLVALLCCGDNRHERQGSPCYFAMALGLMFIIIAKWVICSVLSIFFGHLDPTWVLIIISALFSYMLIGNVRYGYED